MQMNPIILFLKGAAMGAANVIPGVSGGTIALITGIYERIIQALRGFQPMNIKFLLRGDLKKFWRQIDGSFLTWLFLGVGISILTLARLLEWLLEHYEKQTFGFFFGLIAVSIFYVGKAVDRWRTIEIFFLIGGTAIAVGISFMVPGSENGNPFYVGLCGVAAICSMILPGLSGSFVLILMGNYTLVLEAINQLNLAILVPLALGCGFGLLGFAQVLGWLFKRYRDVTLATMTGFVLGSLLIIWPWKSSQQQSMLIEGELEEWVSGYIWYLPPVDAPETWLILGLAILGGIAIILIESLADPEPNSKEMESKKD